MSEHDAHNTLTATARMRALAEPVEDGKLMTFSERMYRAREARLMHGGLDMYGGTNGVPARTGFDKLVRMPPALHLDARTVTRDTSSYAPWGR